MRVLMSTILVLCAATCFGQANKDSVAASAEKIFLQTLRGIRAAKKDIDTARKLPAPNDEAAVRNAKGDLRDQVGAHPLEWAQYLAGAEVVHSFLSKVEQQRIDKQVGSGPNTSGTTSLVSKGSVPALLGLAVENGGVTQETNGTTITFRVNPAQLINCLAQQNYLKCGPTDVNNVGAPVDPWYKILSKASFSASFDTSKGPNAGTFTAERSQLTGYSGHYDIINHRDPRDKKNQALWEQLRSESGPSLAGALTDLASALNKMVGYNDWLTRTTNALDAAASDEVASRLSQQASELKALVEKDPTVVSIIKTKVVPVANDYVAHRLGVLNQIDKSLTLAFDYSNTRQVVTLGNTSSGTVTLPPGVTNGLPDLGNFLLTAAGRFIGQSEITANFSGTRFNGRRPGPDIGRWRDVRAGAQIDVPLPGLGDGKTDLSFSYLYLNLLEEPLGAKIMVNGVEVSRTGTINFGQAKVDFPIGSTGMHIPISLTFSNRTELIKERDVRGNIGITFDLDKLFSKNQ